jgi:hypothetical protein
MRRQDPVEEAKVGRSNPAADAGRRQPRSLVARPRRPPWWEVPPQGYLEVESRNSPTSPRALRSLARAAVNAGLSWDPGNPLPVQRYVEAQERARLVFQARRELPRVTAVASQVMLVDRRLADAEEALRQAAGHLLAAAAAAPTAGPEPPPDDRRRPGHAAPPPTLHRWSEAAILVVLAAGQGVLAATAAAGAGLRAGALGLLSVAAGVGSIIGAQLAARGLHRLGATPDGADHPGRRRQLDIAVAGGALACGVTLATAVGQLGSGAGPVALGLALLGLATAVSYAAIPVGAGTPDASRWWSLSAWLRRRLRDRRARRRLQAARAGEVGARAAVRELREELAVLVPQLFAAEQSALLFWRYQVAIGDAAQRGFEQHLAAYSLRRSSGLWRPISDWWRGASLAPPGPDRGFMSVGAEQPDWGDQVARITMPAKRVLVRRGLLDITHGLRGPAPPDPLAVDGNGGRGTLDRQAVADSTARAVSSTISSTSASVATRGGPSMTRSPSVPSTQPVDE